MRSNKSREIIDRSQDDLAACWGLVGNIHELECDVGGIRGIGE